MNLRDASLVEAPDDPLDDLRDRIEGAAAVDHRLVALGIVMTGQKIVHQLSEIDSTLVGSLDELSATLNDVARALDRLLGR